MHPAVLAWNQIEEKSYLPVIVEELNRRQKKQKNPKSRVYRLHGEPGQEKSIIAKLCNTEAANFERRIYEQILTQLPFRVPRLYGARLADDESKTWLFLEDAGDLRHSFKNPQYRQLAVEFLASLHTESLHIPEIQSLPDAGLACSFSHLQTVGKSLKSCRKNPALNSDAHATLDKVERYCTILSSLWSKIEELCERFPRTLVHGDFKPNNTRIRQQSSSCLLVFDWEMAGIGIPGLDLATARALRFPDAARQYFRMTRHAWPGLSFDEFSTMVYLGLVFRAIALTSWAVKSLSSHYPEESVSQLNLYGRKFEEAFAQLHWRTS
jgi:thiamine kinase-like enzyme